MIMCEYTWVGVVLAADQVGHVAAPGRHQLVEAVEEGQLLGRLALGGEVLLGEAGVLVLEVGHLGPHQPDIVDGQVQAVGDQAAGLLHSPGHLLPLLSRLFTALSDFFAALFADLFLIFLFTLFHCLLVLVFRFFASFAVVFAAIFALTSSRFTTFITFFVLFVTFLAVLTSFSFLSGFFTFHLPLTIFTAFLFVRAFAGRENCLIAMSQVS